MHQALAPEWDRDPSNGIARHSTDQSNPLSRDLRPWEKRREKADRAIQRVAARRGGGRWKSDRDPKPSAAVEIPLLNEWDQHRLWAKIQKGQPDQCWRWTGGLSGFGHGRFKVAGKLHSPHRLIYALKVGRIVNVAEHHGSVVMHSCDNPACCNPAHLKLGRQIDNALDMATKGRCGGARHLNARPGAGSE